MWRANPIGASYLSIENNLCQVVFFFFFFFLIKNNLCYEKLDSLVVVLRFNVM